MDTFGAGFFTAVILLFIVRRVAIGKAVDKVATKGINNMLEELDGMTTLLANLHTVDSMKELHKYTVDDVLLRLGKIQARILMTPMVLSKENKKKLDRVNMIVRAILNECTDTYNKLK